MLHLKKLNWPIAFIVSLIALLLLSFALPYSLSQTSSDPATLSYQAYTQLASVYRSGGQAPDLVAKLNQALSMIQSARIKRAQGDIPGAIKLEDQARALIQPVLDSIPGAQAEASRSSSNRIYSTVALIPVVVLGSTIVFYAGLWSWRYYEKLKLYEMRIIEKKSKD